MTEVAKDYDIKANTLRYYESIGLLPTLPRQSNGNRYFTEDLLKWLEMVICLRHSGVPIETLVRYCELLLQGEETQAEREALLRQQREELYEKQRNLQRSIDRLSHKINLYESGEISEDDSYYQQYSISKDKPNSWKE